MKAFKQKNNRNFTVSAIALSVAAGLYSGGALAQTKDQKKTDNSVEVIQVKGIRGSLEASTAIKRNSMGVVDAISAEDIGKFPDTNLAESLQRITGVSISRTNGEGAEVTVRGFGAGYNMVTLNGRMMPAASTYGAGSGADGTTKGGSSRAFDFSNLASESVKAVEVYKTGKANIATGGIGATINIETAKPLDSQGFQANVGVKADHDTTNRTGQNITPELSSIISYTNDEATFGVGLSFSHQRRDSGYTGATVNDWNIDYWDDVADPNRMWNSANIDYVNAPSQGQLYARPNDIRYAFSNTKRVRDNGQLTVQFRPMNDLTSTVDYTYANNNIREQRGEITNWVQTAPFTQKVEFDNSAVKTPIYMKEVYPGGIDEGYEQQWREQTNTLKSLGLNLNYQPTDNLKLILDGHHSSMYSRGTGPRGSGELAVGLGAPIVTEREWNYSSDLPTYANTYDDSIRGANNNGVVDPGDVGTSIARIRNASQKTTITQIKFDGSYEFDDGRFDFGLETRAIKSRSWQTAGNNIALGNWNVAHPGDMGDLIKPFDLPGEFKDYPVSKVKGYGFIANAPALYDRALQIYPGIPTGVEDSLSFDDTVKEDTQAAYFQFSLHGDLGGMPFDVLTGLRYETTDVTSTSLTSKVYFNWEDNNDIIAYVDKSVAPTPTSAKNSYDNMLPSMDFSLNITNDLKGRFSFSKTIARAGLGSLGVSASNFGGGGGSTMLGAHPTANASNPGLLPLESTNFDLSLEWYYNSYSYVSVGLFQKNVINFIGSKTVDQPLLGIRDVTNGPRAKAAAQAVKDRGFELNDTSLYAMMVLLSHPEEFPNGAADYTGTQTQIDYLANHKDWDLQANQNDPEMVFRTNTPDNSKEAKLYGAEFAIQHFFGETGFGVQANYTLVRGDVGFNTLADPNTPQFALLGLSDTANLVGIYEKDGWQARIAYNWRGQYLSAVNKGGSNNPEFVEAYHQIDATVSYDFSDQLSVSFQGINLTGENSRSHARNRHQLWYLTDLGARYQVGVRYKF